MPPIAQQITPPHPPSSGKRSPPTDVAVYYVGVLKGRLSIYMHVAYRRDHGPELFCFVGYDRKLSMHAD